MRLNCWTRSDPNRYDRDAKASVHQINRCLFSLKGQTEFTPAEYDSKFIRERNVLFSRSMHSSLKHMSFLRYTKCMVREICHCNVSAHHRPIVDACFGESRFPWWRPATSSLLHHINIPFGHDVISYFHGCTTNLCFFYLSMVSCSMLCGKYTWVDVYLLNCSPRSCRCISSQNHRGAKPSFRSMNGSWYLLKIYCQWSWECRLLIHIENNTPQNNAPHSYETAWTELKILLCINTWTTNRTTCQVTWQ